MNDLYKNLETYIKEKKRKKVLKATTLNKVAAPDREVKGGGGQVLSLTVQEN
jgi:hypothetical protein